MKEQLDLLKEHREKQEKYTYYVVALSVASIAFAVTQTSGQPLKFTQIPLAFSVICWGISIYKGLSFIGIVVSVIHHHILYLDLIQGKDNIAGTNPHYIKIGVDAYVEHGERLKKKSSSLYKWQHRFFYLGTALFIVWRVFEMALVNK
jgi:hypothetical protein